MHKIIFDMPKHEIVWEQVKNLSTSQVAKHIPK